MTTSCAHTPETNPLNAAARAPDAPPRKGRPSEALGAFDLRDHIDVALRRLGVKPDSAERDQWLRQEWAARNPAASLEGETYFIRKLHGKRDLVSRDIKQLHGILGLYQLGLMECCTWLDFGPGDQLRALKFTPSEFDALLQTHLKDHEDPFAIFAQHTSLSLFAEYERGGLENLAMIDGHEVRQNTARSPHTRPRRIHVGETYRLMTAPVVPGHLFILHSRAGSEVVQIANEAFGLERTETLVPEQMFESPLVQAPSEPGLRHVILINWPTGLDAVPYDLKALFDPRAAQFDLSVLRRIAGAVLQTRAEPLAAQVHVRLLPMDVVAR